MVKNQDLKQPYTLPSGKSFSSEDFVKHLGVYIDKDLRWRVDTVDQYQQILQDNVQASVTKLKLHRGWIFQQDNDPKHSSNSTKAFMQREKY